MTRRESDETNPAREPQPIRIALVADTPGVPRWVRDALQEAEHDGHGQLTTFVHWRQATVAPPDSRTTGNRADWTQRLYALLERYRFRPNTSYFEFVEASTLGPAVEVLTVVDASAWPTLASSLAERGVQLVLNISEVVDNQRLADIAELGAAAFALSDAAPVNAPTSGLEELLAGESVVRVRLEHFARDGNGPGRVLDSVANAHPFSAGWTRHTAAWNATALLSRMLRDLRLPPRRRLEEDASTGKGPGNGPRSASARRRALSPVVLGRLLARYSAHLVRSRVFQEQWELGVHCQPQQLGDTPSTLEIGAYRPLRPPADRFWADPFPLGVNGRAFVLLEELPYATKVGHLSVIELRGDEPIAPPTPVLERPYHLSYPFVFEHEGETFLVPETALEGRVELYRAVDAPFKWVFDRVLLHEALLDATIVQIEGRWWMFAGAYDGDRGAWNTLVLYHASSPFGPWTPHPRNPVVTDVRCARPAGRVFWSDGAWHRPAQDCARTYGAAMTLRRIVHLSETEYQEVEVARIASDEAGIVGVHTLNASHGIAVIDRKRLVRRR